MPFVPFKKGGDKGKKKPSGKLAEKAKGKKMPFWLKFKKGGKAGEKTGSGHGE
jgi:hypothetical protein